jgi:hypothetical protein
MIAGMRIWTSTLAVLVVSTVALTVLSAAAARTGITTLRGCVAPTKWSRAPHAPFSASDAETYKRECQITKIFGPRKTAREYGIRSSNWLTICVKVETETYRAPLRPPAIAGCMRGFSLWDKTH